MKNITQEEIKAMIGKREIPLQSTHARLCVPVINKLYKKMKAGIPMPCIKICENMICDGHHRYIASLLAEIELERAHTHTTAATHIIQWIDVVFEDDDWDVFRKQELLRFNRQDAQYLQIEVHELLEMLN